MKKITGILVVAIVISALTWAFLELREEGYLSSHAAQPESPAPPQTAGASLRCSLPNLINSQEAFLDNSKARVAGCSESTQSSTG